MPEPRERMATNPEGRGRSVMDTGQWPALPVTAADVGPRVERLERHMVQVERRVGMAAVPAEGIESSGMYRAMERGFEGIATRLDGQDTALAAVTTDVRAVLARDAAADLVRERRGKTTADVILYWVKGAGLAAIVALFAFLIAHFRWKDSP